MSRSRADDACPIAATNRCFTRPASVLHGKLDASAVYAVINDGGNLLRTVLPPTRLPGREREKGKPLNDTNLARVQAHVLATPALHAERKPVHTSVRASSIVRILAHSRSVSFLVMLLTAALRCLDMHNPKRRIPSGLLARCNTQACTGKLKVVR